MESLNSLMVDLGNPSSISEKLPEAEETLRRVEEELQAKQAEVSHWQRLVAIIAALTNEGGDQVAISDPRLHLTELQSLVVGVVNRDMRKIRARDVTQVLNAEGIEVSSDSVSNCLWYVAERVEPSPIRRIGRGFYAPAAYKEEGLSAGEMAVAGLGAGALAALLVGK